MATLDAVQVRDYMTTKLITFAPEMEVKMALKILVEHGIAGAPVVDGTGKLVGILSERDCLQIAFVAIQQSGVAGRVSQFMSSKVETVDPDMSLTLLASMFTYKPWRRYPVLENGVLVGQISRSDVMRAINNLCY
jgi:CBS domain-containing protein